MKEQQRSLEYRRAEKRIMSDTYPAELASRIVREAERQAPASNSGMGRVWWGLSAAAIALAAVAFFRWNSQTPATYEGLSSYSLQSVATSDQIESDWNGTDAVISSALESR